MNFWTSHEQPIEKATETYVPTTKSYKVGSISHHVRDLAKSRLDTYGMKLELKFSSQRQYYLRFSDDQLESKTMPENFINVIHRKNMVECSTLSLVKRNQKVRECCAA